MERLQVAEDSIRTAQEVIENERAIRKDSSQKLKGEIQELEALVLKEKKSLSDKVSAELDSTLKAAVKERVQTKKDLDRVIAEKA